MMHFRRNRHFVCHYIYPRVPETSIILYFSGHQFMLKIDSLWLLVFEVDSNLCTHLDSPVDIIFRKTWMH